MTALRSKLHHLLRKATTMETTMKSTRLKLNKLAIQQKLDDPGCVVECDAPMLGGKFWQRIRDVRDDKQGPLKGLHVQEYRGLGAWYTPAKCRCRALNEGEKPLFGKQ